MSTTLAPTIGTYQEKSLHAALKAWYAAPGDRIPEQPVDGYVADGLHTALQWKVDCTVFPWQHLSMVLHFVCESSE